jgi:hypothetical protein
MTLSRRQLAAYGLSVADLARAAGISYGRCYMFVTGAQNLTDSEQKRVTEVVVTAMGNAARMDAVTAGTALRG